MSFSVFEKIDPSCQNGSMEKAKNIPYHQRPYASIAERTLVDISIYSPRPQIAGTGHSHSKISIHSPRMGRDIQFFRFINGQIGFQSTLPTRGETANAYNLSARKVVVSVQHSLIFDSSLLFPAVQNWFLG